MASHRLIAAIASFADQHHGVVTRSTLLRAGVTDDQILVATSQRLLTTAVPGVYLIGRATLTPRALREVALQHAAPAMLAGMSAGEQYGWFPARAGVVRVSTARPKMATPVRTTAKLDDGKPGLINIRATTGLDPVIVDGLRTAPVPRALVEIAGSEGMGRLTRAWKQADYGGVLDLAAIEAELSRSRRPGVGLVRQLWARHPGRGTVAAFYNSPSEVNFRQLVADAGLPDPEVNVPLIARGRRYVVDFLWRWLGLVGEVDDPSHDRPLAQQADRIRHSDLFIAGFDVIHFDTRDLGRTPDHEMQRLAATIERQRQRHPGRLERRG